MELECKFYSNQARLANALQFLSSQPSFRFFCVKGIVTRTAKEFKVLTPCVTAAVSCVLEGSTNASMILVTSDPVFAKKDGALVNTDDVEKDVVYYNLCVLLREKYAASKNKLAIEFIAQGGILEITINEDTGGEFGCRLRGQSGDMVIVGDQTIHTMLDKCQGIRSFSYSTRTVDFARDVHISEGTTEILKEIAKYLNRTLVFVSFTPNDELLEQYIGGTSALEVITRSNGSKVYKKVIGSRLRNATPFCVYQSTMRVEDVAREQGKVLHKTNRG